MSIVNVTTCITSGMNIFEAIAMVALGFVPTIAVMEAAWKLSWFERRSETMVRA